MGLNTGKRRYDDEEEKKELTGMRKLTKTR